MQEKSLEIKLFDSELKVMNVLWDDGDSTAKHIALRLAEDIGWNVNTTYTVIKKCIAKGAIERREPNFICHALVSRREAQESETAELIDKLYEGAADKLVACLLGSDRLSRDEIARLKKLVEELK
ncbi:MAG: BlaI/MecI/CopY family transcriptional regulator [Clostridiales bacterium]|nr:BlaI/MecI/CopY family transcriptional regulator [Clostridiales bacterium]